MATRNARYYIMMLVTTFLWGGSWVSGDLIVELAPPMAIGFLRFMVALIPFLVLLRVYQHGLRRILAREHLPVVLATAITGILGYGVFFLIGMHYTTSAQGSIIAGLNPTTITIFSYIINRERLERRWQYLGLLLSFIGVVFVIGVQALFEFRLDYLVGNLLIVLAMVNWGMYSALGKRAMRSLSSAEMTTGSILFGTLMFGVASVNDWNDTVFLYSGEFWFHIFFLGILVTFVGYILFFESVKNLGGTRTGVFINLVPVFGVLLSVMILGEELPWTFVTGLILILAGISVINAPVSRGGPEALAGQKTS